MPSIATTLAVWYQLVLFWILYVVFTTHGSYPQAEILFYIVYDALAVLAWILFKQLPESAHVTTRSFVRASAFTAVTFAMINADGAVSALSHMSDRSFGSISGSVVTLLEIIVTPLALIQTGFGITSCILYGFFVLPVPMSEVCAW